MPAPYRELYVKPVLGNTYAAVAASTEFSEWVQVPDRTAAGWSVAWDIEFDHPDYEPGELVTNGSSETQADGPAPTCDYPEDINGTATGLADPFGGIDTVGGVFRVTHSFWSLVSGTHVDPITGEIDDDPFYYAHATTGSKGGDALVKAADPDETKWSDDWRPAYPPGAIGYEVELPEVAPGQYYPLSELVEAHVNAVIAPSVPIGQHLGGLVTRLVVNEHVGLAPWRLDALTGGHLQWASPEQAPQEIVNETTYLEAEVGVPSTGVLAPPEVRSATWPVPEGRRYDGGFAAYYAITMPVLAESVNVLAHDEGSGRMEAATGVDLDDVTYTIRPPRIRWIYAEPQRLPYRRVTRRRDGLAGGARRTGGRVKTIQGSNRRGAGAIV
jgi:hypothetical protein